MLQESKEEMLQGFWMAAYIAAIVSGKGNNAAKAIADTAHIDLQDLIEADDTTK